MKRDLLGKEDMEVKAKKLLNRSTFRRSQEKREFVEALFDLVRNLPLTIFAVIMERPLSAPRKEQNYLPNQFRYLLQRCDLLAQKEEEMLTILFDGYGGECSGLVRRFGSFLYRSQEGRAMNTITDAPFFVDSKITAGIQIADMAAGCIRLYEENTLFRGLPPGDPFLSAIRRYYQALEEKTLDQRDEEGYQRSGFYRMPERDHYFVITNKLLETEAEDQQPLTKPENQA